MASRPCKRCRMPIEMIRGPAGPMIPAQKVRTVYELQADLTGEPELARVERGETVTYVSHFETCPYANEFRKGGA